MLREERRLDDEVRLLEAKAKAEDSEMYSGTVSSPRELQAMQADIDQLRRQARELEDEELEVLERREALDAEVAEVEAAKAGLVAEMRPADGRTSASGGGDRRRAGRRAGRPGGARSRHPRADA